MDFDALAEALNDRPAGSASPSGVIYIPRPHAPTGSCCSIAELERLAEVSRKWLLVVDEAYHQFAENHAAELATRFPHVVLLRTFSKAWGLAGIRVGYALASDEVAKQLRKLVPPFAASVMQTVCVKVALANPAYMHDRVQRIVQERRRVTASLSRHPSWVVASSWANFLLIRTPDAQAAHNGLLTQGILVRRQDSHYGLGGCIRVTIGTRWENDEFLRAAGLPDQ